jgi:hypothetical protein
MILLMFAILSQFVQIGQEQLINSDNILLHDIKVVSDGSLIATSLDRHSLHLIDTKTSFSVVKTAGGKGKGPGEFSNFINSVNVIGNSVYVSTFDNWVHIFDKFLNFQQRVFLKDEVIYDLYKLNSGKYIASAFSLVLVDRFKNHNYLSIRDSLTESGEYEISRQFSVQGGLSNFYLSRRVISVGSKYVVTGQKGSNVIFFLSHNGNLTNAVKLTNTTDQEIEMFDPSGGNMSDPVRKMLAYFGITDFRLPSGNYITSIRSGIKKTFVQGGIYSTFGPRSITIVDHDTWASISTVLPDNCQLFDIFDDQLYCLTEKANSYVYVKYRVNA